MRSDETIRRNNRRFALAIGAKLLNLCLTLLMILNAQQGSSGRERPPLSVQIDLGSDPGCQHKDIWGPYQTKPGHPTLAEKHDFIELVSKAAKDAEARFGVPASGLTAMAILESGYGFTRLALNAQNIFGYKYPTKGTLDHPRYTLKNCLATSGPDRVYVAFGDFSEAVFFVAERLASVPIHKPTTDAYGRKPRAERTRIDVQSWVLGIARAGYAAKPEEYTRAIIRIMNDPYRPSDTEGPQHLYSLSLDR
jgi:hypothetical protein